MSPELWATLGVGVPVAVIAGLTFFSGRSKEHREDRRRDIASALAPIEVRVEDLENDMTEVKHDMRELRGGRRDRS